MKSKTQINIIVAVDSNGGYANGREIPWSFEADWKHFKSKTKNSMCVMGRGTYEDIAERRKKRSPNFRKLLPNRDSYVVSHTLTNCPGPNQVQGAKVIHGLDDIRETGTIFLLGGFHLWMQYWNYVDRIYMTIVPGNYKTTKKFPVGWLDKEFKIVDGNKEVTEQGEILFVEYWRK